MEVKRGFKNKRWFISIAAAVVLPVLGLFALGETSYAAALLWIIAVLTLLVWGNIKIHQLLEKVHPWGKLPLRRFLIQFLISGAYSLVCINLCYYFLKTLFIGLPPDGEQMLLLNIYGLLFYIPVMSINFGVYFMQRWKKAALRSEQLQAENLKSRLESLKMHIDPHFLFNNLNVLSSLIDIDTADAHRFLDKFAEVYRYVLQHRDEELVELDTEIEFIHSYIYLFQQRLNRQLKISIDYHPSKATFYIPTLALQMLLENAIKHNIATVSQPLTINIFMENERYIIVENTYQPKNQAFSSLPKSGLDNIIKRLAYFSDEEMVISQNDTKFTVKLPLLKEDSPTSGNH
ncbi:histidine kinase [Echinicola soli]|uniref:Histidine kinase n=1 Tax=Echinicola soli TaxID=2591634 RepID=A0A514CMD5_9BACT|nr:histidine kinase [Echinicola soli]QDH80917.1 histidine kinase [Echinicola soli]